MKNKNLFYRRIEYVSRSGNDVLCKDYPWYGLVTRLEAALSAEVALIKSGLTEK